MKRLILLFVIVNLLSCKTEIKKVQTFSDIEWKNILTTTFAFAEGKEPYVFKNYENEELKELISSLCEYRVEIGYEFNDSIYHYINNRKNKPISNRLDTMLNISFVSDTNLFKENLVIYSEPFYLNDSIVCISMSNKIALKKTIKQKIFFLKKRQGTFNIIEYFDVNKDKLYSPVELK